MGIHVFNPTTALQHGKPSKQLMQEHVKKSKLLMVLVSPSYFDSEWCRAEVEAAMEANVLTVPVYSGDDYTLRAMQDLINSEDHKEIRKFVFSQNLVDVNNTAFSLETIRNIKMVIGKVGLTPI